MQRNTLSQSDNAGVKQDGNSYWERSGSKEPAAFIWVAGAALLPPRCSDTKPPGPLKPYTKEYSVIPRKKASLRPPSPSSCAAQRSRLSPRKPEIAGAISSPVCLPFPPGMGVLAVEWHSTASDACSLRQGHHSNSSQLSRTLVRGSAAACHHELTVT